MKPAAWLRARWNGGLGGLCANLPNFERRRWPHGGRDARPPRPSSSSAPPCALHCAVALLLDHAARAGVSRQAAASTWTSAPLGHACTPCLPAVEQHGSRRSQPASRRCFTCPPRRPRRRQTHCGTVARPGMLLDCHALSALRVRVKARQRRRTHCRAAAHGNRHRLCDDECAVLAQQVRALSRACACVCVCVVSSSAPSHPDACRLLHITHTLAAARHARPHPTPASCCAGSGCSPSCGWSCACRRAFAPSG